MLKGMKKMNMMNNFKQAIERSSVKRVAIEYITLIFCIVIFALLLVIVSPYFIVNFSFDIGFALLSAVWFGFAFMNIVFSEIFYNDGFTVLFALGFAIAIGLLVIDIIHIMIKMVMLFS